LSVGGLARLLRPLMVTCMDCCKGIMLSGGLARLASTSKQ